MTILITNHTAHDPHHGCRATCHALETLLRARWGNAEIRRENHTRPVERWPLWFGKLGEAARARALQKSEHFADFRAADLIVVNAEGSFYAKSWRKRAALSMQRMTDAALSARVLGKEVWVVNGSAGPSSAGPGGAYFDRRARQLYGAAAHVAVREPISWRYLKTLSIEVAQSADAIFSLPLPARAEDSPLFNKVVFTDSSLWRGADGLEKAGAIRDLAQSLEKNGLEAVYVSIFTDGHDRARAEAMNLPFVEFGDFATLMAHLQNAQLVVTGRFHLAVFAAHGAVPFVPFAANTPKIAGLSELLRYPLAPLDLSQETPILQHQLLEALERRAEITQHLAQGREARLQLAQNNIRPC